MRTVQRLHAINSSAGFIVIGYVRLHYVLLDFYCNNRYFMLRYICIYEQTITQ